MKQEYEVKRLVLNERLFSLSSRDIELATKPYTAQYAQKLDSKKMYYESKISDALSTYEIGGIKIDRRRNFIPDSDKSITFVAIGSCILYGGNNRAFALIAIVTKFSKQDWKPISSYAYLLETASAAMYQQIATHYKKKWPTNKYERFANKCKNLVDKVWKWLDPTFIGYRLAHLVDFLDKVNADPIMKEFRPDPMEPDYSGLSESVSPWLSESTSRFIYCTTITKPNLIIDNTQDFIAYFPWHEGRPWHELESELEPGNWLWKIELRNDSVEPKDGKFISLSRMI